MSIRMLRGTSVAAALTVVLALAGCGSSEKSATDASGDGTAPTGAPDPTGELRLAHAVAPPLSWDPGNGGVEQTSEYSHWTAVYDSLVQLGPDGALVPGLATEWKFSSGGKSLTMKIREGVTFRDGAKLDAKVVKANLDRTRSGKATGSTYLKPVTKVTVVDPMTVELKFSSPQFGFPLVLATWPAAGAIASPEAIRNPESLKKKPVGSGPYDLVELDQAKAVYERVPDHWNQELSKTLPKRVSIGTIADDNARLSALQSGQVDAILYAPPQYPAGQKLIQSGDYHAHTYRSGTTMNVGLNKAGAPELEDPAVVRALSQAIDRAGVANAAFGGVSDCSPTNQWIPKGKPGYVQSDELMYDLDAARAVLEPKKLSLKFAVVGVPYLERTAVLVQQMWAKAGVNVELQTVEGAQARDEFRSGKYAGLIAMTVTGGFADPSMVFRQPVLGSSNPNKVQPELQEMIEKLGTIEPDDPEQTKQAEQVTRHLLKDPVSLPLCERSLRFLASDRVLNLDKLTIASVAGFAVLDVRYLAVTKTK